MTAAGATPTADKPTAVGALRCFWIAAVDCTATGEAVVYAPAIPTIAADTKGSPVGHATTAKAQPAERRCVPDSAKISR